MRKARPKDMMYHMYDIIVRGDKKTEVIHRMWHLHFIDQDAFENMADFYAYVFNENIKERKNENNRLEEIIIMDGFNGKKEVYRQKF